jgi:hypothetical protein
MSQSTATEMANLSQSIKAFKFSGSDQESSPLLRLNIPFESLGLEKESSMSPKIKNLTDENDSLGPVSKLERDDQNEQFFTEKLNDI